MLKVPKSPELKAERGYSDPKSVVWAEICLTRARCAATKRRIGHDDLERARLEAPGAGGAGCDTVALGMASHSSSYIAGDFAVGCRMSAHRQGKRG
jgi:hypothetical protein